MIYLEDVVREDSLPPAYVENPPLSRQAQLLREGMLYTGVAQEMWLGSVERIKRTSGRERGEGSSR